MQSENKTTSPTSVYPIVMRRFWVSWRCFEDDYRPINYPPNKGILGWWCSGQFDGGFNLCALVEARNESAVAGAVMIDWPEASAEVLNGWRIFEERDKDWVPGERFPLSDWMIPRVA